MRMFLRAVNNGWPLPEAERDKAKAIADAVLADPQSNNSERLTATVVLGAVEKLMGPPGGANGVAVERAPVF